MSRPRVIPALLIRGNGLYKGIKFKDHKYVGDPINAIKIFNDKEVDELCVFDIQATIDNKEPNYELIKAFATECFMPCCYGGGIQKIEHAQKIFSLGIEKVSIGAAAYTNKKIVSEIAQQFGASSTVVCIDYKKNIFGKNLVHINQGKENIKLDPLDFARMMESEGAGELIINSIDRDGTMQGYDIEILEKISSTVTIPTIGLGGAGKITDLGKAIKIGKVGAAAAGSMFVFYGKLKGVLVNFPTLEELKQEVYKI